MARRSEHSQDQIRQMVMNAAENIVQNQGFSALKVRKVASDIGYTVGSIYMVFTNMDDLNMHIKARTWQKLALYLEQQIKPPVSQATIETIALAYLDFVLLNRSLWQMLFEHQLAPNQVSPDWYLQAMQRIADLMYDLLTQLETTHTERQKHQAADILIKSLQGLCTSFILQEQSTEEIKKAKQSVSFLVHCFIAGWLKEAKESDH